MTRAWQLHLFMVTFGLALSAGTSDGCEVSATLLNRTCSAKYSDLAALTIQNLISTITTSDCELACPSSFSRQYNPKDGEEFDFIVVGAGSAGSVVANRLTEVSGWSVLLLEAGGDPPKTSEVPAMFGALQKTKVDWQYQTVPSQDYCLGMVNNSCNWPRGKVLGGSSSINYMLYLRGNAKDYEGWKAQGNTGWGYDDVLPYFKKSEDMRAKEILGLPDFQIYHGTGGYLKVETFHNEEVRPLSNVFASGMQELGYPINPDVNGKTQTGYVKVQGTLEDGRRCSTAKAFLRPIKSRANLKISKHSRVTKVLIDKNSKSAYGVKFVNRKGEVITVRAKKEVVLSAGALNTPQILMLSGVGPRKHLTDMGIEVIQDLPVGENLEDHHMANGIVMSVNFSKPTVPVDESMYQLLMKRKSRLSGLGLVTDVAFVNTVKGIDYPDMQLLPLDFNINDPGLEGFLKIQNFRDEIIQKYKEINSKSYVVIVLASLMRPYSTGSVQLSSIDPKQHPKLTAGYFSDSRDVDTYLRTYDIITNWVQTKALKSVDAKLHEIEIPACSKYALGSNENRECSLRHLTATTYHYTSSCRMGPDSSTDSVVDPTLKVKGIKGLRIVDASVMPSEVTGNINGAVIMVGEKGSDLIKMSWT